MTHVNPSPSTCQPMVHAHLAKVVDEVTKTLRVQRICGVALERDTKGPEGQSHVESLLDFGSSGLQEV
jgi:hypothetical protein